MGCFKFAEPFDMSKPLKRWEAGILGFWIFIPTIWFWFEYYFLFKHKPNKEADEFDRLKHGQDQSAKIWLALVTVLLGMYFGIDLIREAKPQNASCMYCHDAGNAWLIIPMRTVYLLGPRFLLPDLPVDAFLFPSL